MVASPEGEESDEQNYREPRTPRSADEQMQVKHRMFLTTRRRKKKKIKTQNDKLFHSTTATKMANNQQMCNFY